MTKKCENIITFINESLYVQYLKSTWWIDSGATVQVANSTGIPFDEDYGKKQKTC